MTRVKKEKRARIASSAAESGTLEYPVGTLLAVDLYGHGNFFEAVVQSTDELQLKGVVKVQYADKAKTVGTIDLNDTKTVELVDENIISLEDCADDTLSSTDKGFLGRRLTVQWEDNKRYSGKIIKSLRDQKNFVFIHYDDGDKVWYNLSPDNERPGRRPATKTKTGGAKSKIKSEEDEESASIARRFEKARMELTKKYPVGCTIAVDSYHDEHYHEAIVRKYFPNPSKTQQTKGEQWVYLHWLDKDKTKNWVDLNCIKAIKVVPEKIIRLDELTDDMDKGFLGKRIVVQWKDGNKYCGLATKCAKDNKHFLFLEYDDGDRCWCDLQRESYWSIDGEEAFDDEEDEDFCEESSESSDDGGAPSRTPRKRKAGAGQGF